MSREIEIARPQTAGEEELQLQLALAMSKEEAEQEEQKRKSDDVRLQLALSQSQQDFKKSQEKMQSHMVDLLDVNLGGDPTPVDPWGMPQPPRPQHSASALDPWQPASANSTPKLDPWGLAAASSSPPTNLSPVNTGPAHVAKHDPWSPTSQGSSTDLDEFDIITNRNRATSPKTNGNMTTSDPFELNLLGESLSSAGPSPSTGATKKTPQSFLGENSALVNLDNLVTTNKQNNPTLAANPFSDPTVPPVPRPVFNTQPPKPSINEIKQQSFAQFSTSSQNTLSGFGPAPSYSSTTTDQFRNNGTLGNQAQAVIQDPWTPITTSNAPINGNGNVGAPWMKANEPANPFLS